jgi:hypothetical protein
MAAARVIAEGATKELATTLQSLLTTQEQAMANHDTDEFVDGPKWHNAPFRPIRMLMVFALAEARTPGASARAGGLRRGSSQAMASSRARRRSSAVVCLSIQSCSADMSRAICTSRGINCDSRLSASHA